MTNQNFTGEFSETGYGGVYTGLYYGSRRLGRRASIEEFETAIDRSFGERDTAAVKANSSRVINYCFDELDLFSLEGRESESNINELKRECNTHLSEVLLAHMPVDVAAEIDPPWWHPKSWSLPHADWLRTLMEVPPYVGEAIEG